MKHGRGKQAGLTLVEVMVAIVIGLVVVIAGLALYLVSANNSGLHRAQARVTADLANAIAFVSAQARMAGYSAVRANAQGTSIQTRTYEGPAARGCEGGYADPAAAVPACNDSSAFDGVTIYYESDAFTSATSAGTPLDCRGQPLPVAAVPPHLVVGGLPDVFHLAETRIYVAAPAGGSPRLVCSGNGGASPFSTQTVTLAEGVVDFQLTYSAPHPSGLNVSHANAQQVVAMYGDADQAWRNVQALEVCLVLSSANEVLDAAAPYVDCAGDVVVPPDRRLYRVGRASVALRNQIPSGL